MQSTAASTTTRIRDFEFTDADFERVRKLIYKHGGISLSPIKRDMVYSRLSRRLRAVGVDSFNVYLDRIEAGDPAECEEFTNSLTTNLTSFFREPHHFPILEQHLRSCSASHPLLIWCCAASTGEEPYSIAIAAAEAFGTTSPPIRILASDLDTAVLAKAELGVYPMERVSKIAPERLRKFFLRGTGAQEGMVRIRQELRDLVTFKRINMLDENWPIRNAFDVIFCRNIMIYFDKPTQLRILERFAPLLKPESLLFMGHSESLHHATHLFRLTGQTVYRLAPQQGTG